MRKGYVPKPIEERFWANVQKGDGCWEWQGYKNPDGYGYLSINRRRENLKKNLMATRLSWRYHFGEFDESLFVLHKCDNPACVRPDHLFLGTNTDNMRDCVRKGRDNRAAKSLPGERNPLARLTWEQVREIRSQPNEVGTVLAEKYGVPKSSISGIRRGISWRER